MPKRKRTHRQPTQTAELCLDQEKRLCEKFDQTAVAKFPVAERGEVGNRVVDNCAEEHMM